MEGAPLRIIGHVHPSAGSVTISKHLLVDIGLVSRSENESKGRSLTGTVRTLFERELACFGEDHECRNDIGCDYGQLSS